MHKFLIAVLAVLILLVPGRAAAQPARRAAPSPEVEARSEYRRGLVKYELGEYEGAITSCKRAYDLTRSPALLFNIAQAYRLKNDPEQALHFYQTFLRLKPDAKNRAEVEGRINELEKLLAERQQR